MEISRRQMLEGTHGNHLSLVRTHACNHTVIKKGSISFMDTEIKSPTCGLEWSPIMKKTATLVTPLPVLELPLIVPA